MSVLILIPVFNNFAGLVDSIGSISRGSLPHGSRVLVVDDGSKVPIDSKDFDCEFMDVLRIEQNSGIEVALRVGVDYFINSGFRYLGRLDAGDAIDPDRFLKQFEYMEKNAHCGILGSDVWFVDPVTKERLFKFSCARTFKKLKSVMCFSSPLIHPSLMIRRDVFVECGNYSFDFKAAEDYEFMFRVSRKFELQALSEALTTVSQDGNGISAIKRRRQLRSRLKVQIKYLNVLNAFSLAGVFVTFVLMLTPHSLVLNLKRKLGVTLW